MNRQGLLLGFLAGGWVATILFVLLPHLGLSLAVAEDGPGGASPLSPPGVGPSVNPVDGFRSRGGANPGLGTSDSNRRAIALSASIGSGQSVVYYFDTVAQRLCVYQYDPGGRGGLRLLAARLIDFDLRLEQYRDISEKTPTEMREAFEKSMRRSERDARGKDPLPVRRVDLPGGGIR